MNPAKDLVPFSSLCLIALPAVFLYLLVCLIKYDYLEISGTSANVKATSTFNDYI